ncbi:hypothetical protein [Weissella cibaria]|jgi:hypothetical protein|uniref:hypothetical protein n=1 Tax=Weissella cibaria TaxID=137591 RepID=UPI000E5064C1|nr:hypothetical protein [Weissella cibaria]RHE72204.1 hypothetical protein DW718_06615 [Weissella cibaria]RHE78149.1 hypothetical protein DW717_04990 [Weissella cibaria]
MYYLVNKQATTLTFYFEDGTQDFGLEQLFNLSRTAFAETIAPYGIGDHIEEAMAFEQTFSAYERKDLEIATKDELIDLVIAGQEEAVAIRKSKEDTLAMTLGLVVAGPFIFLLVLLVLESIGMPKMAAEICSLVLTIGLIIAWFILVWSKWGRRLETRLEDSLADHFKRPS